MIPVAEYNVHVLFYKTEPRGAPFKPKLLVLGLGPGRVVSISYFMIFITCARSGNSYNSKK